ncbi:MAG: hypothetical protein HY931_02565 [Candidatus Falkowbacteria bacterium]|nr:MAG: hypothetical protein HY931_02565 [Candidatus Falkowbacteria bacterium]
MSKDTIVAAINGGNGKKVQGVVSGFKTTDGKNVFVEFTEQKSSSPQDVHFDKVQWPHHKAATAAQTQKTKTLDSWRPTNGINSAEQLLHQDEVAEFFPAD